VGAGDELWQFGCGKGVSTESGDDIGRCCGMKLLLWWMSLLSDKQSPSHTMKRVVFMISKPYVS
jgi:hypothetical protein